MTGKAAGWLRRVVAVLLLAGGLMIASSPAARADNCDIRINPLDCQNTAWVIGSVAAVAACGAVIAASVSGGQRGGSGRGDRPSGAPPDDAEPGPEAGTAPSGRGGSGRGGSVRGGSGRGREAADEFDAAPVANGAAGSGAASNGGGAAGNAAGAHVDGVEGEIKVEREHTICAVAAGFQLYWDARDELVQAGIPGGWLPGTEDFLAAARRAGFVAPEQVRTFADLYEALRPLPDASVYRLVLLCHGQPDGLGFAGGWSSDARELVFTSGLTTRDIRGDPRVAQLSRVFGRRATVDIYAAGAPVAAAAARALADALKVRVRTFAVPVRFHIAQARGLVGARGAMSCPGLRGSTARDLLPPLIFEPVDR
jgi:hypothetical protein